MGEIEPRVRTLENIAVKHDGEIRHLNNNVDDLELNAKNCEKRFDAIEKSIIRLTLPLKAATWAAAAFALSMIALIWSLIIGKAYIIFR